jgi:hypothetical protein
MQQKQQKPEEQNSKNRKKKKKKNAQLNRKSKLKTARYVAIVKN